MYKLNLKKMKKYLLWPVAIIFFTTALFSSCGSESNAINDSSNEEDLNIDDTPSKEELASLIEFEESQNKKQNKKEQTVIATYVDGSNFEGEAKFVFQKEDGKKIEFERVVANSENIEPALDYDLISEDLMTANKKYIGVKFEINYRFEEGGCWDIDGNVIDCYKINSLKLIEK